MTEVAGRLDPKPPRIELAERERSELQNLVRAQKTGQALARRVRVVLLAATGYSNADMADMVPMDVEAVGLSRRRWFGWRAVPVEEVSEADRLSDAPRPGAVPRLTAE